MPENTPKDAKSILETPKPAEVAQETPKQPTPSLGTLPTPAPFMGSPIPGMNMDPVAHAVHLQSERPVGNPTAVPPGIPQASKV